MKDGSPPNYLTGIKFVDNDFAKGTPLQRKHCRYSMRGFGVDPATNASVDFWACAETLFGL